MTKLLEAVSRKRASGRKRSRINWPKLGLLAGDRRFRLTDEQLEEVKGRQRELRTTRGSRLTKK